MDTQAIGGWNGPGPYLIENNYLEAAGENVMFGGADPTIPNLVPSDITLRLNHLIKPRSWQQADHSEARGERSTAACRRLAAGRHLRLPRCRSPVDWPGRSWALPRRRPR